MTITVVNEELGVDHEICCYEDMSDEEALQLAQECNEEVELALNNVTITRYE